MFHPENPIPANKFMNEPNDQAEIPTPRSDGWAVSWNYIKSDTFYVPRIHVRQLERELHQANEENKSLKSQVAELEKAGGRLVMELENLRTDSGYNGNSEGMDLYHTAIDSAMKST